MKLLSVFAAAAVLSGCAATMEHPTKSLAEQSSDRRQCEASSKDRSEVSKCLVAIGYVEPKVDAFPFDA